MHPSLAHLGHRPWPIPVERWVWRQSWHDLLFAHWPVPAADLRRLVPPELTIQEFDGTSWVGVVPFRMSGVMRRPLPNLPYVSAFPELNLRLYVENDGKPGVWFISLDAANALAVWAARRYFHLPYWRARMSLTRNGEGVRFRSARRGGGPAFAAEYRPVGDSFNAAAGTLEAFLVERYCLYAKTRDGRLLRGEVHHPAWPLHRAQGTVEAAALLRAGGVSVSGEPLLHFSPGVHVVVWPFRPVN